MSDFASPEAAAIVEAAMKLPHYEAIQALALAGTDGGINRQEVVLAMAEALVVARTHAISRELTSDHTDSDDVLCTWRWGDALKVDAASQSVGFPILFGRRRLKLWLPLRDLAGMASSYFADVLRSDLKFHLDPDREV